MGVPPRAAWPGRCRSRSRRLRRPPGAPPRRSRPGFARGSRPISVVVARPANAGSTAARRRSVVGVEPAAGLATETSVGDEPLEEDGRAQPVGPAEAVPDRPGGRQVDVDADQVDELERAEREAALAQRRVDRLDRSNACFEHPQRLERVRAIDAVDDEPRRIGASHRGLVPGRHEGRCPLDDGRIRALCRDDLDQRHDRSRVEEVEPEDSPGPGRRCRNRSDRQRARIRRQEHLRPAGCVEGAEDRPLQLEVLERRLDHDAGLRTDGIERVRVTKPGQPTGDPFVDAVRVEVQARGSASEAVADPGPTSRDRGLVDVVQDDLVPVLERQLGDPRAHRARPDDSDDRLPHPRPHTGLKPSNGWRQAVQW